MRRDDVRQALDALASEVAVPRADATSAVARGRRRVALRRVALAGVTIVLIAAATTAGLVANSGRPTRVVGPAPRISNAGGPATEISAVSAVEAWKCLNPLRYTNDGGRTWRAFALPAGASSHFSLCTAVAGGNAWVFWATSDSHSWRVMRVRNGRDTQVFAFPRLQDFEAVVQPVFVDADHGWAQILRNNAPFAIYRTIDGGAHWNLAARNGALGPLTFANTSGGWGTDGRTLSATSDGGATWHRVALPLPSGAHGNDVNLFQIVAHGNAVIVWGGVPIGAVRYRPFFDVSTDGGRSWTRRAGPAGFEAPGAENNTFDATDARHWELTSGPEVRVTGDAGSTWQTRPDVPGTAAVGSIAFPTDDIGWITTIETGAILRTTDGGRTWGDVTYGGTPRAPATTTTAATRNTAPLFDASQYEPPPVEITPSGEAWICGSPFEFSADRGTSWQTVKLPAPEGAVPTGEYVQPRLCAAVPGAAWLLRPTGIPAQPQLLRVRDGGAHVDVFVFTSSVPAFTVDAITFVDPDVGWALVSSGQGDPTDSRLYATRDGGKTWAVRDANTPLVLDGNGVPAAGLLSFVDTDRGWGLGPDAILETTADGGRTWRGIAVPTLPAINYPPFLNGVFAWGNTVVAWGGRALSTGSDFEPFVDVSTDGGRTWTMRAGPKGLALPLDLQSAFSAADANNWLLATGNRLYATGDGGRSWSLRAQFAGVDRVRHVAAGGPNVDLASAADDPAQSSVVLQTDDAGQTWNNAYDAAPPAYHGTIAPFPGGIVGCPTRPLTTAPAGNPPAGLAAAAIANVEQVRHWPRATAVHVYPVGTSPPGSFGSVFNYAIGSCGVKVANQTWVVELEGPPLAPALASRRAQLALAHYADGWSVFGRYH